MSAVLQCARDWMMSANRRGSELLTPRPHVISYQLESAMSRAEKMRNMYATNRDWRAFGLNLTNTPASIRAAMHNVEMGLIESLIEHTTCGNVFFFFSF